jgi:hypothetical protein
MAKSKIIVIKIINTTLILFIFVLIYQLAFADHYSFSNDRIDLFFHNSTVSNTVFIFLLIIILLFIYSKKNWQKLLLGLLIIPIAGIFLFVLLFTAGIVGLSQEVLIRQYFYQKNGYNYYVISERYFATEHMNFVIYKEKPVFLFLKKRERVKEAELMNYRIDMDNVYKQYFKKSIFQ